MNLAGQQRAVTGLRTYLRRVADALGADPRQCTVELGPTSSARFPLPGRLPWFPERALTLAWDERHGWSAQLDGAIRIDRLDVSYLGVDVLPTPGAVLRYVRGLLAGAESGTPYPRPLRDPGADDDLGRRLGEWAAPGPQRG